MTTLTKLSKKINNLSKKLKKLKKEERIKKIKENKVKRKKRAIHLFILGNIFKYAKIDNLEEETLIGYCLSLSKVNPLKLDQYTIIGKNFLAEKEIKRQKEARKLKDNITEKSKKETNFNKKEYSRIIRLGAIFEMTKIDTVELPTLIGFILDFKNKTNIDKNNYFIEGKIFKFKKSSKPITKIIS